MSNASTTILESTKYDRTKPMTIVIHGYQGTIQPFINGYASIINALKKLNATNVFGLYDEVLSKTDYLTASTCYRILGEMLGEILGNLYAGGISNYHLIGHSLGAHTSGFAGKTFEALTGTKLNRISGLDPAGPCFFVDPQDKRLTQTDADFVDVIHTNMNTFGINKALGHADFFPNGGEKMAGCLASVCSHNLSPLYYAESIENNNFLAVPCSDWKTFKSGACAKNNNTVMGYWTPTTTRGNYYLITNGNSKYAKGQNGIIKPPVLG